MIKNKDRKLLFSVGMKDLVMQTFTVGGHGGSGKDTSNTGVRLIHPPSNARAEGREHRSVERNRRDAFSKLVKTKEFITWHKIECAKRMGQVIPETPEQIKDRVNRMVDEGLMNGSILIEEFGSLG
jgi:protein subunit release factor A